MAEPQPSTLRPPIGRKGPRHARLSPSGRFSGLTHAGRASRPCLPPPDTPVFARVDKQRFQRPFSGVAQKGPRFMAVLRPRAADACGYLKPPSTQNDRARFASAKTVLRSGSL